MSTSAGRTSEQYAQDVIRIGQVIRAARVARSMTLSELSELIQAQGYPKVLPSTCGNWEIGVRGIMSGMVEPLSVVLGVDPAELWMPEHDMPEPATEKARPRRDSSRSDTLDRARQRIAAVAAADSLELWRELAAIAEGWLGALHVEQLIDRTAYEELDAELRAAVADWDGPLGE